MARPTKRTPEREKVILDALRVGATRTAASEAAGVERTQFWRWMGRYATFRNAVMQAEAQAEIRMTITLRQAGETDWRAATWWLERRRREDWGRVERIEINTLVDELAREHNFTAEEAKLAADEAERWLRAYRRRHGGD